ncbi:MAG: AAA family ATPase [Acidimicrobiales bacterium]
MTESDDMASRGRAIFERLRGQGQSSAEPAGHGDGSSVEEDGIPMSRDLHVVTQAADGVGADVEPDDDSTEAAEPDVSEPAGQLDGWPVAGPGPSRVNEDPPRSPLPGLIDLPTLASSPVASRSTDTGVAPLPEIGEESPRAVELGALAAQLPATPSPPRSSSPVPDAEVTSTDVAPPILTPAEGLPDPSGRDGEVVEADAVAPVPAMVSHFARDLPRVMAVANQKGGVGKTTTAVNLGACLADLGYRVLVVDLDPQGNASTGLGINIRDLHGSMYDVILHDLPIEDCVEATSVRNLFCAPSSLDLAGAEIELVPAFSRELRLKRALVDVHDDYDFVLIDCPPSLGLLTVNGLAAATEVVVPIQCEYYALEGLGQLLRNVNLVQRNLNPTLEVSAIILVMYDARTKLADQVVREVREHFGTKVCRNVVPRTVRLSEAPSFGQPIIAFDPSSRGAIAYRELAKEVSGGTPQRAG